MKPQLCRVLIDERSPAGDVLELACGTGYFTAEIVRHAQSVTALDASPRMLAINERRVANPTVTYVNADTFAWQPDRSYHTVFFGAWLSHVPPTAFDDFWALVRTCLAPNGRVAFVDEDDRAAGLDDRYSLNGRPRRPPKAERRPGIRNRQSLLAPGRPRRPPALMRLGHHHPARRRNPHVRSRPSQRATQTSAARLMVAAPPVLGGV